MYGYIFSNEMDHIVGVAEDKEACERIPDIIRKDMRIMTPDEVYDTNDSETEKIGKLFAKAQGYWDYEEGEEEGTIVVDIEGDWKHDHAFCDTLMESLGYTLEDEIEDGEDDGDDFYYSRHYYKKNK